MARIPIYEDRLTPQGFGVTPQARGVEVSDAVGRGMQRAGEAGMSLAAADLRNQRIEEERRKQEAEKLKKKDDDDAIVGVGSQLATATAEWPTRVEEIARNSTDGGLIKEGDKSVPMTQKITQEFQAYREKFLAGVANPRARQYAEQHLNSLWASTYRSSLAAEAKLGVENRYAKVEQAVDTYASEAAKDATQAMARLKDANTLIANAGLDEPTRVRAAMAAKRRIVEAAITGELMRNPGATRAALLDRWSMTEADLTGVPKDATNKATPATPGASGAPGTPAVGGFDSAVAFTLRHEGGLNPADTNGTPSKFGINAKANPDVDLGSLTKEGAAKIYKDRYWNAIGGDTLAAKNPALAMIAFDTAVIAGTGKAKELLAKAGDDPARLVQLREEFQASLLRRDPAKFGKYERAWATRNAELRSVAGGTYAGAGPGRGLSPLQAATATTQFVPNVNVGGPASPLHELVSQLEPERVPQFVSATNTEINRAQAVYRSQLTTTEGDHVTAYMNGQPPQRPLTEAEYVKAYGPIEGPQRYANYQAIGVMGQDITALKLQTPEQIQATVERYKPDPTKPGYELANKRYAAVVQAADAVVQERQADPMLFAQRNRIGDAKPLPFNDQAAFGAELTKRVGVAATMRDTYQAPFSILTKAEAQTLSEGFQRMTTQQKLGYLNTIRTSVTDPAAYRALVQQIAPDSPVTAMAGIILQKQNPVVVRRTFSADDVYAQRDVAAIMLEGEALLNPGKGAKGEDGKAGKGIAMPKEEDIRNQFTSVVGRAFSADPNGANFAYQAVKAYYAGKSAREGDVSGVVDSGRLKEAINAVIGGVTDVNGKGEVIRPWGMSEERFKNGLQYAFTAAIAANGYKGSLLDNFGAYGAQSAGDGKYLLRSGSGYLTDKSGNPIVLDVLAQQAPVDQIPTDSSLYRRSGGGGREVSGKVEDATMVPPATVFQPKNTKPVTQQQPTK